MQHIWHALLRCFRLLYAPISRTISYHKIEPEQRVTIRLLLLMESLIGDREALDVETTDYLLSLNRHSDNLYSVLQIERADVLGAIDAETAEAPGRAWILMAPYRHTIQLTMVTQFTQVGPGASIMRAEGGFKPTATPDELARDGVFYAEACEIQELSNLLRRAKPMGAPSE